jgi:hypothetical protein
MSEKCDFHPDFEVNRNIGYDFADVNAWVEAAVEYIGLLQAALNRSAVYLHVHGWKEDDAAIQRGKELRATLGIQGSEE